MFSFLKRKKIDPKARLKEVLRDFKLPSFPAVVTEVLDLIRNPDSSAADIARPISLDPGLSVQVLKLANSVTFSPTRKIENLNQAVALVGLAQMETLVLSVVVAGVSPQTASLGYEAGRFWRAAARRGVLARSLTPHACIIQQCTARESECFTAGFLQDMAIPFLAQALSEEYGRVLERWHTEDKNLTDLEREVFDWDHAEVGTWICSEWKLPENIASAIGGHHSQGESTVYDCPLPVALVSLLKEDPDGTDQGLLLERIEAYHSLSKEQASELMESSFEKADDLSRLMI